MCACGCATVVVRDVLASKVGSCDIKWWCCQVLGRVMSPAAGGGQHACAIPDGACYMWTACVYVHGWQYAGMHPHHLLHRDEGVCLDLCPLA